MELVSWHQLKLEKYNNKNIQPDSQPGDLNNKIRDLWPPRNLGATFFFRILTHKLKSIHG